jgi:hypothetical protein
MKFYLLYLLHIYLLKRSESSFNSLCLGLLFYLLRRLSFLLVFSFVIHQIFCPYDPIAPKVSKEQILKILAGCEDDHEWQNEAYSDHD